MTIRTLAEADFPAAIALDATAFGFDNTDELVEQLALPALRAGTPIGEEIDGRLVSLATIQLRELTVPGGATPLVATVTWVAVSPDLQRQGLLRNLMRHQLHGLHETGGPAVAILTASESGIYRRFGYGMAIEKAATSVPSRSVLRSDVVVEPVRETSRDVALPLAKALYERVRPTRVGYLGRDEVLWAALYSDLPPLRGRSGALRFVCHRDGFVAFRIEEGQDDRGPRHVVHIRQLCAATPVAAASLWHHLLNRGLVREVRYQLSGPDEVLRDLLVDPRAAIVTTSDNVWVRLVDWERAVPLRGYRGDVDVVVEVADAFCPWNAGTWRFVVIDGKGRGERSDERVDVRLDVADLGAAFLGGSPLVRLAAAGVVQGEAEAIEALGDCLATARRPYTPETF